jgi:hypothetical protein
VIQIISLPLWIITGDNQQRRMMVIFCRKLRNFQLIVSTWWWI